MTSPESPVDYRIRSQLQPGDIGSIVRLHGLLHALPFGWDATFEAYVAMPLSEFVMRNAPDERIWVVESGSGVSGSIALVKRSAHTAQLRWFLLVPELRGRGIGKALMEQLITFAKQQSYQAIELWTVTGLEASASLYRRYGFQMVEEKNSLMWGDSVTEQKYLLELEGPDPGN